MFGYADRIRSAASALKTTTDKKIAALQEGFDLSAVLTPQRLEVVREPFPHVVADNFFQPHFYEAIEQYFAATLARGLSETRDRTRFRPFLELQAKGKNYDGYMYVPAHSQEHDMLRVFYSVSWNLFFSKLFGQPTGWTTEFALHHHPPGDRTGFVHHDYAIKKFTPRSRLENGVILHKGEERADSSYYSQNRIIALLYFLSNEITEESGGGTGLYAVKDAPPIKIVAPRNNRLLAFQISPKSFHAFQANHANRNALVQWFHIDPAWCERTYGFSGQNVNQAG